MSRFPRGLKARPYGLENTRQTLVLVAIAAFLALSLLAYGKYLVARQCAAAVLVATSDDEIYTGSILYVPYEGTICHQILFDNRSGRMRDNGNVDCERAAYRANPENLSSERLQAISIGFRDR